MKYCKSGSPACISCVPKTPPPGQPFACVKYAYSETMHYIPSPMQPWEIRMSAFCRITKKVKCTTMMNAPTRYTCTTTKDVALDSVSIPSGNTMNSVTKKWGMPFRFNKIQCEAAGGQFTQTPGRAGNCGFTGKNKDDVDVAKMAKQSPFTKVFQVCNEPINSGAEISMACS